MKKIVNIRFNVQAKPGICTYYGLKAGDLFQWRNRPTEHWSQEYFVMLKPEKNACGQSFQIRNYGDSTLTWFAKNTDTQYRVIEKTKELGAFIQTLVAHYYENKH